MVVLLDLLIALNGLNMALPSLSFRLQPVEMIVSVSLNGPFAAYQQI